MNSFKYINSILRNEKEIFIIKKTSERGFLDNTIFGFIHLIRNRDKDYFLITDKRIIYLIKNKIINNSEYINFSKITFNSNSDSISYINKNNDKQNINLRNLRLSYEEIQKIKKFLN